MTVALILSLLCIFSGHKPGMMEQYNIFTLNASRIGENLRQELDEHIMSIHLRRSLPLAVEVVATPTVVAPTTLITVMPLAVSPDLDDNIDSQFDSLTHKGQSELHHQSKKLHSKVSSAESDIKGQATSALGAVQTEVVQAVKKAFHEIIGGLDLADFYSVHLMTTCSGDYVTNDGKNVAAAELSENGTDKRVRTCKEHDAINPTSLILVVYWIGTVFTAAAFLSTVTAAFVKNCKLALINISIAVSASAFMGLASAVTHGIAVGAAKLVNFVGSDIGIAGYVGRRFLALTWTTTLLLLIQAGLCIALFFVRGRNAKQAERVSQDRNAQAHIPLASISRPMHVQTSNGYI